jgi:hypothetical protein
MNSVIPTKRKREEEEGEGGGGGREIGRVCISTVRHEYTHD